MKIQNIKKKMCPKHNQNIKLKIQKNFFKDIHTTNGGIHVNFLSLKISLRN